MYDSINQQSVRCTGRSMENLPWLRAGAGANHQNNGRLCVSLAPATTFPPSFCLSLYSFLFNPPPPPPPAFTFSFNASISYLCIPPHSSLSDLSFFLAFCFSFSLSFALRLSCSLLVYWFSRLRIPGRGIVTHNHKIILGCAYLPFPCIYLACVCRQLCFLSPDSGANNEGQIESYV